MITHWWWVRHGPTHAKAAIGWTDLPADLSDTGALRRLEKYLPEAAVVVSSDLSRAVRTADAIQANRPRLPHEPDLREMNYGDWEGINFATIAKTHPELSRAFWQEPGNAAPPNGESWNAVSARVAAAILDLTTRNAGQDIVAVAHFGVILSALQTAIGADAKTVFPFKLDNLSVTRIDYLHDAGQWRVIGVNHRP